MDPDSWLELLLLVAGLGLSLLALAADLSVRVIPRPRVQHLVDQREPGSGSLQRLVDQPGAFSIATVVLGSGGLVLAAATATLLSGRTNLVVGLLVFVLLVIIARAMVRDLAVRQPEQVALWLAGPLRVLTTLFAPVVMPLLWATSVLARLTGSRQQTQGPTLTEEELRAWVDASEEAGVLEEEEREMIDGILEMEETTAHEIMVPRPDIVAVPGDASAAEGADLVIRHGYSRLPVYQENIDNILGIVYAKDLLRELREGRPDTPIKTLVRPAYFVPESKKVNEILQEIQQRRVHLALVVDEYGGIAGMLTIEDLLEEIVGEIQDEHGREEPKIQVTSEGEATFDATVSIDDVNDTLSLHLRADEVDTIGGLVYQHLGKMPTPGDVVHIDGASITVVSTTGRRIRRVKVAVEPPAAEPAEES